MRYCCCRSATKPFAIATNLNRSYDLEMIVSNSMSSKEIPQMTQKWDRWTIASKQHESMLQQTFCPCSFRLANACLNSLGIERMRMKHFTACSSSIELIWMSKWMRRRRSTRFCHWWTCLFDQTRTFHLSIAMHLRSVYLTDDLCLCLTKLIRSVVANTLERRKVIFMILSRFRFMSRRLKQCACFDTHPMISSFDLHVGQDGGSSEMPDDTMSNLEQGWCSSHRLVHYRSGRNSEKENECMCTVEYRF